MHTDHPAETALKICQGHPVQNPLTPCLRLHACSQHPARANPCAAEQPGALLQVCMGRHAPLPVLRLLLWSFFAAGCHMQSRPCSAHP